MKYVFVKSKIKKVLRCASCDTGLKWKHSA